ncbi:MAG: transposase [Labilibaculum sp.]|nr:transposase [Labilibaculum sp.]
MVYCKQPFLDPNRSSNTSTNTLHKVAISNHRLIDTSDGKATFMAKDYRQGGKKHPVSLRDTEFIRRFCFHILPKGFTRIRHYGILKFPKTKHTAHFARAVETD